MESRNPVFARTEQLGRGGYATFDTRSAQSGAGLEEAYAAPSATTAHTGRMTIDDVVMRTASIFAVLLATAAVSYFVWQPGLVPVIGSAIVGFVLAMVISFSKTVRPPLILLYGAVEGVFVGGISYWYSTAYGDGLIGQAVLGTLFAFGAMLALYKVGAIRATPRFTKILLIAGVGYFAFAMVNILGSAFGAWDSVYSGGGIVPILVSAFGVVLASLFLVLDFDTIERGIQQGAPQQFAWVAAFGLVVTLVWLYLEMLRLLAILRGDD